MMPVLFKIGSLPVHSWGLLLMIAFIAGTFRAARNAKRYNFKPEDVWDIALIALIGGIVGARLAFVLLNLKTYMANPVGIIAVWTGGMTFYGGLFGGILAGGLACRKKDVNFVDFGDLAALSLPIGYAFGRIGCFLNGCCYGGICESAWHIDARWEDGIVRHSHPTQLYGVIAAILTYFLLLPFEKHRRFRGQILLAYILLYAVYRFVLEFYRVGATAELAGAGFGLTQAQVASLIFAAFAGGMMLLLGRKRSAAPQAAAR